MTSPANFASSPVLATPEQAAQWLRAGVTGRLHSDSRQVGAGDGFIAWPGAATDGRRFVPTALAQGAAACLVAQEGVDASTLNASVAAYSQLKAATGPIAAAFYGHPSRELALLAVTGTNGKTSCTWWLAQALSNTELSTPMSCAVVGTLGVGTLGVNKPPALLYTGLTTPDPVTLQHHLREFITQGTTACAIEASSIGIAERRLDGCDIRVALFTNFTHDHLDYHGSMEAYWQAKAELFRWPSLQAAVVNLDDPQGVELAVTVAQTRPTLALWTYGLSDAGRSAACLQPRLQAHHVRYAHHSDSVWGERYGLCFEVQEEGVAQANQAGEYTPHTVFTSLIGQYNVSNLLGVIGTLRALGIALTDAVRACCYLTAVPGRMECLGQPGEPLAVVDYAHTPDALDKALAGLRPLAQERGGQLWCVFGCGGDRDPAKRPLMAAVAEKNADQVMVTSDNPRSEKPEAIISQILLGLSHGHGKRDHVHVEPLRASAIVQALHQAAPQDVVLIAGKGHEDYQEIAGVKHAFSDPAHALAALASRAPSHNNDHLNNNQNDSKGGAV
jgi:UDP-N-acetylmuramoyl-L-alanyl-D-glutamate--2,6-diaminopimelate ligase